MLLIFIWAEGLELFCFFSGVTLTLSYSECMFRSVSFPPLYTSVFSALTYQTFWLSRVMWLFLLKVPMVYTLDLNALAILNLFCLKHQTWNPHVLECWLTCAKEVEFPANDLLFIGRCICVKLDILDHVREEISMLVKFFGRHNTFL